MTLDEQANRVENERMDLTWKTVEVPTAVVAAWPC